MANDRPALPPLAEQGVNLINEDNGVLDVAGDAEQPLDELLALAQPLAGQAAGADVDQVTAGLRRQGPGQQSLAVTRRPEHQQTLGRLPGNSQSEESVRVSSQSEASMREKREDIVMIGS